MPDAGQDSQGLIRVGHDLECARCGYNLRTLDWEGVCPECGLAVRESRLPADFVAPGRRAARRIRAGLAVLAAALLLDAMLRVQYTFAFLHFFSLSNFWRWAAHYGFWYGRLGSHVMEVVALVLIARAFVGRAGHSRPRLAWAAMVCAIVALFAVAIRAAGFGPLSKNMGVGSLVANLALAAMPMLRAVSWLLVWALLFGAVPAARRGVRWALVLVVPGLLLILSWDVIRGGSSALLAWGSWETGSGDFGIVFDADAWRLHRLFTLDQWWDKNVRSAGWAVVLVAMWPYLRGLRAGPLSASKG